MVNVKLIIGIAFALSVIAATLSLGTSNSKCLVEPYWESTNQEGIYYCADRDIYRACSSMSSTNKTCYHIENATDINSSNFVESVDELGGKETSEPVATGDSYGSIIHVPRSVETIFVSQFDEDYPCKNPYFVNESHAACDMQLNDTLQTKLNVRFKDGKIPVWKKEHTESYNKTSISSVEFYNSTSKKMELEEIEIVSKLYNLSRVPKYSIKENMTLYFPREQGVIRVGNTTTLITQINNSPGPDNNTITGNNGTSLLANATGLIRYLSFDVDLNNTQMREITNTNNPSNDFSHGLSIINNDSCVRGQCMFDDGTDNNELSVEFLNPDDTSWDLNFSNGDDFTFASWVQHTTSSEFWPFAQGNPLKVQLIAGTSVRCQWNANISERDTGTITLGTLNHIACRKNSTHLELFINGVGSGSPAIINSPKIEDDNNFCIGHACFGGSRASYLNGMMDETMIFDKALTDAEIQGLNDFTHPIYNSEGDKKLQVFNINNSETHVEINMTCVNDSQTGCWQRAATKKMNITDELIIYQGFDNCKDTGESCFDYAFNRACIMGSGSNGTVIQGFDQRAFAEDGVDTNDDGCVNPDVDDPIYGSINTAYTMFGRMYIDNAIAGMKSFAIGHEDIYIESRGGTTLRIVDFGLTDIVLDKTGMTIGVWHDVFGFFNGTHLCLQIDDSLSCDPSTGTPQNDGTGLGIGADTNRGQYQWDGKLDDMILWNRSLSTEERACVRDGSCLTNWSFSESSSNSSARFALPVGTDFIQPNCGLNTTNSSSTPTCTIDTIQTLNTTAPVADVAPAQPDNLTNITTGDTSVNLTFKYNCESCDVNVYLNGSLEDTLTYPLNSTNITGLTASTSYNAFITAVNGTAENLTDNLGSNNITFTTAASGVVPDDPCAINLTGNTLIIAPCNYTKNVTNTNFNVTIDTTGSILLQDQTNWTVQCMIRPDDSFLGDLKSYIVRDTTSRFSTNCI